MPELPDVEGFRRFFAEQAAGARVERVSAPAPDVVRNTTPQGLGRALRGRRFGEPARHGKWLFAPVEGGSTVVWHFGMTGALQWVEVGADRHPHDRVVIVCDRGELRLRMMRKLGGVWLARDADEAEAVTGPLGPDAWRVDRATLGQVLTGGGSVKSALMNQERLAGAGNLVADEVCWRAGVHPRRALSELDDPTRDRLHDALHEVLDAAVPTGRVPPHDDWLTGARDDEDPTCPRCGAALERGEVAGRSTWWCPREQQ